MKKCLLLFCLLWTVIANAQSISGSITGTVFDQVNAVVPGARITAANLETGIESETRSTGSGSYLIPALRPGRYRVVCENPGFKSLVREPIEVATSSTVTLDLTLSVGETSTEVVVTAEAPIVQQANATVQYNINLKAMEELPLPDQSALNVLNLLPGVVGEVGSEAAAITTGYTMPGTAISISGSRMGATQYKADGISNNSMFFGRISLSFSSDAIQEVTVQQNGYSAEFGRVGGGVVQMTTRSGTNELHGTLFSFSQNDALNAAPYANTFRTKGKHRYWRGGIDVGGPVVIPKLYDGRNRTFFFFGYEPRRQNSDFLAFTRVPTELEREGDFSQSFYNQNLSYPVTIYRQFEYDNGGNLSNTRIVLPANTPYPQFEGNRIPQRLISPIGKALVGLIPAPNYPTQWDGVNRVDSRGVKNVDDRVLVKLDQAITDAHRFSGRIAIVPTTGERFFQGGKDSLINATPTDISNGTNIALSETWIVSPNKINEFRAGYNRSDIRRVANDAQLSKNWFQEYGIPSGLDRGMVRMSLNDFQPFATDVGNFEIDNIYEVNDSFTWIVGRHMIKIGGEFQALQQNLSNLSPVQGVWDFNSAITSIGSFDTSKYPGLNGVKGARTGFSIASLLLGFPNGINMAAQVVPYQYRWKYMGAYLQDDFKVTPRLTLNLGVRYQVEVPRSEKHHNQGYFVNEPAVNSAGREVVGYLQMNGLGGAINTLFPTRYNNIEPRLGLAYRLPGNGFGTLKVIRTGYAITHTPTNGLFNSPMPNLNPRPSQLVSTGGQDGGWVQLDRNALVLPQSLPAWPSDGKFADLQSIDTPVAVSHNVTIPYLQQWNFGLGFEFAPNYGLEVNYVGSKGTNLFGPSTRTNTIDLSAYTEQFKSGLNMGDLFPNPQGIRDQNGNIVMVSRANLLRPNPLLGSIADAVSQGNNSIYNALQVQFQKRYSHGFQVTANYTWSKSIDTVSCEGQFCTSSLGMYAPTLPQLYSGDRGLERSISSFDTPHVFRIFFNWDLPFGSGQQFFNQLPKWANYAVGGWKLSGIASAQSNLPIIAQLGSNAGWPDDVGNIRPNWAVGGDPINHDWKNHLNDPVQRYAQYINVLEAFETPSRFTLGNVPRTISYMRGPSTGSFDLNVMKDFQITERVRLSLRGELYNALNHPFISASQANKTSVYSNLNYTASETPTVTRGNLNTAFTDYSTHVRTRTVQLGLKLHF